MNKIKCSVKDCDSVFETPEGVFPDARFICKNHPRKIQVKAVGRKFNERFDNKDQSIHFQDTQFDKKLRGKRIYVEEPVRNNDE
jgi:hypothetical protein